MQGADIERVVGTHTKSAQSLREQKTSLRRRSEATPSISGRHTVEGTEEYVLPAAMIDVMIT